MIVVWGGRADPPVAAVLDALDGDDVVHLDRVALSTLRFDVTLDGGLRGWIASAGRRLDLRRITAMFVRPEAQRTPTAAAACLLAVAARTDAVVVNRPAAGRSNLAKPFQLAEIAAAGLAVPPTLVTTDPDAARQFLHRHGRIVYKSISGVRSIVAALDAGDAERLDGVRTGPVQLQRCVEGIDVRVHVVGKRWLATSVESAATDYRYGGDAMLRPVEIDSGLGERLASLAAGMGLLVAGIDLRRTPDGQWYCLEVNPSPGFTFYEEATGQPIAAAIADLLRSGRPPGGAGAEAS